MSDPSTLEAYEARAAAYAAEWEDEQDSPTDLHALIQKFFAPGSVFDVGCGSGRDAAWLAQHGYEVIGFDASEGLIAEARRRHPNVRFEIADLPDLVQLADRRATNVLCETVIMHLPEPEIRRAVRALYAHVNPGGVMYLSWRVTADHDFRDPAGRLYAAFDAGIVAAEVDGSELLYDAEERSASSGRIIRRMIVRRPA